MKSKIFLIVFIIISICYSQVSESSGIVFAKEFSKEQALYKAKKFVMNDVIGAESYVTKFEIDPLASASSGELTSLVYKCKQKKISGLVLGFFGDRWNEMGVVYQSYGFKNLQENEALELLTLLDKHIAQHSKYLKTDSDNNNIFFKYDDLTFLVYNYNGIKIRVFWNDYDSEWESTAFNRTKKRFVSKINN